MERVLEAVVAAPPRTLVFANLVDFDTMWGHRNDARAYALGLEEFDGFLGALWGRLAGDDLLLITSDHGNDPTARATDHTRELVPLLAYHAGIESGSSLGVRRTLADLGATLLDVFRVGAARSRASGFTGECGKASPSNTGASFAARL